MFTTKEFLWDFPQEDREFSYRSSVVVGLWAIDNGSEFLEESLVIRYIVSVL